MFAVKALRSEIRAITEMATNFEKATKFVKVDVEHSVRSYEKFYDLNIGGMIALKTTEDIIVGGLGYVISEELHFPRLLAIETFWFVLPEYRGKGLLLWDELEKIANEQKCNAIAMIHLEDSSPEILSRLYRRRGYVLVEKHYVKEINI